MKRLRMLFLILPVFLVAISCNNSAKNTDKVTVDLAKEKSEISQILDNLAVATESGNFKAIEEIWLPSDDVLLIGTESDEKLKGWAEISEAIKKQFGTFDETLISITDQDIWINDEACFAWFFEELNYNFVYKDKAMAFQGIRFTGVMQKIDGKWRLLQQHLSIPAELEMVETK